MREMPDLGSFSDLARLVNDRRWVSEVIPADFLDLDRYALFLQRLFAGLKNLENPQPTLSTGARFEPVDTVGVQDQLILPG